MIKISFDTHLPAIRINPLTMIPEIWWLDRTTGADHRRDDIWEWQHDAGIDEHAFEDYFGFTTAHYSKLMKDAEIDPDRKHILDLHSRYMDMPPRDLPQISYSTHLPVMRMGHTFEPEVQWVERATGATHRIDKLSGSGWDYDGEISLSAEHLFEDTFGLSMQRYGEMTKAAQSDPDYKRIMALSLSYDEARRKLCEPPPLEDFLAEICRGFLVQHTPQGYAALIRNGLEKHGYRINPKDDNNA